MRFSTGRIAQAYMLTGVRGVGKTTTARILARALNYKRDGIDQPTIDVREEGEHCRAIMEGRHVDVIEMDAASHTGIDNMRDILEFRALRAGNRALQGLHHRRSAPAFQPFLQCAC